MSSKLGWSLALCAISSAGGPDDGLTQHGWKKHITALGAEVCFPVVLCDALVALHVPHKRKLFAAQGLSSEPGYLCPEEPVKRTQCNVQK